MRTIRCSALPMLFACAHSQDESDLLIEAYNGAADLGTAVHDAMRSVVTGQPVDVDLFALRHGVDAKDLGPLVWYGRKAWDELRASFPDPQTEVEVQCNPDDFFPLGLSGHIDLLSLIETDNDDGFTFDTHARILDWKSGRKEETDYYAQLAGYAACLILGRGYDSVTATVVWLRSQTVETFTFTPADARAFLAELAERSKPSARYSHGEHCAHCPRSHNCPALVAIGKRDVAIFIESHGHDEIAQGWIDEIDPFEVVEVRRRVKVLEAFADSLDKAIRRRIAACGPLASGDGYALSLVEENGKREIDALKAWPVLQEHLTDEEIANCVTVSASEVDRVVAQKAGRGHGKAAKDALRAELETAGAITQGKVLKLKEIRIQPALKEHADE